jgi:hypothetical protein
MVDFVEPLRALGMNAHEAGIEKNLQMLETAGLETGSPDANSLTDLRPARNASRSCRRCGSEIAVKASIAPMKRPYELSGKRNRDFSCLVVRWRAFRCFRQSPVVSACEMVNIFRRQILRRKKEMRHINHLAIRRKIIALRSSPSPEALA